MIGVGPSRGIAKNVKNYLNIQLYKHNAIVLWKVSSELNGCVLHSNGLVHSISYTGTSVVTLPLIITVSPQHSQFEPASRGRGGVRRSTQQQTRL
jgi:hypothetical protein